MSDIHQHTVGGFLDALASKTPAPGGGATACLAGALACAQAQMVIAYSIKKKSLADKQELLASSRERLDNARRILLRLADEDASAYQLLNELQRLEESDPRRQQQLPAAAILCTDIPLSALATCTDAARVLEFLPGNTNEYLASDLTISAILLEASAASCLQNVRVNLPQLAKAEGQSRALQARELMDAGRTALHAMTRDT